MEIEPLTALVTAVVADVTGSAEGVGEGDECEMLLTPVAADARGPEDDEADVPEPPAEKAVVAGFTGAEDVEERSDEADADEDDGDGTVVAAAVTALVTV